MQFFSLQERSDLATSYKLTEQQNPHIMFHSKGKKTCCLFVCFNVVFSPFLFKKKKCIVHLAFQYNRDQEVCSSYNCIYKRWCSSTYKHEVGLCTFYTGKDSTEEKNISSHCCLAYMLNIDLISNLIHTPLLSTCLKRLFTFTTMNTLK